MKKKVWVYEKETIGGNELHLFGRQKLSVFGRQKLSAGQFKPLGTTEIEITPEVKTVRREEEGYLTVHGTAVPKYKPIPTDATNITISFDEPVEGKDGV